MRRPPRIASACEARFAADTRIRPRSLGPVAQCPVIVVSMRGAASPRGSLHPAFDQGPNAMQEGDIRFRCSMVVVGCLHEGRQRRKGDVGRCAGNLPSLQWMVPASPEPRSIGHAKSFAVLLGHGCQAYHECAQLYFPGPLLGEKAIQILGKNGKKIVCRQNQKKTPCILCKYVRGLS